ncbi:hypothetical protein ACHWGN_29375, partial [Klebsiella pneumoniae]
ALGLVWAAVWLIATRRVTFSPPSPVETDAAPPTDYGPILRNRQTWAVAGAKILSDATWWLLLFWLPDFFHRQYGLT